MQTWFGGVYWRHETINWWRFNRLPISNNKRLASGYQEKTITKIVNGFPWLYENSEAGLRQYSSSYIKMICHIIKYYSLRFHCPLHLYKVSLLTEYHLLPITVAHCISTRYWYFKCDSAFLEELQSSFNLWNVTQYLLQAFNTNN